MRWRIDLDEVEAVREAKQMRGGRVLPPSKRDWDWYTEGRAKKSRRGDPGDRKVGERGEVKMVGWMKVENQDERERQRQDENPRLSLTVTSCGTIRDSWFFCTHRRLPCTVSRQTDSQSSKQSRIMQNRGQSPTHDVAASQLLLVTEQLGDAGPKLSGKKDVRCFQEAAQAIIVNS